MYRLAIVLVAAVLQLNAADPTFLRRSTGDIQPKQSDLTTATARYKPIFGIGDADTRQLRGVARYGELTVDAGGSSEVVSYPTEEQVYFVVEGSGTLLYDGQKQPVKKWDFAYLPVNCKHGVANSSNQPVRLIVMGFKNPEGTKILPTPKLLVANANDAELKQLSGHGPTSKFRLLLAPPGRGTEGERDLIVAGNVIVEMFIMDFAPGGTNIPHHHDNAEEIYHVLKGHGDMVAGGGADGSEGKYPAREGDTYFFRLNATVGFYSGAREGEDHDLILAMRSLYPAPQRAPR